MSIVKSPLFVASGFAALAMTALGLQAQGSMPLVQASSLQRLGSFKVPSGIHSGGQANAGFEYGGTAISYNPARDSLYMVGHDWDQLTGEISIPALGGTATLLQPLVDASEGKMNNINPGSSNTKKVGGTLPWNGKLLVTLYDSYDGAGTQTLSHIIRPLGLNVTGQIIGPTRVGPLGAGFYSGYMAHIPPEWQSAMGGTVLTGQANISVTGRTSLGPAAFAIDPANLNASGAKPLVYYPLEHPGLGAWAQANQYYSGTDSMKGIVFPNGTSTVLFFGRHGTTFCYGPGTNDKSLDGKPSPNGADPWCYDPTSSAKGTHGYPSIPQVWAYDANDLVKVKNGQKQPWDLKPYAIWTLPGMDFEIGGAAYDPATNRLFVSEKFGEGERPLIHVFSVLVGTPTTGTAPRAPFNVRIIG